MLTPFENLKAERGDVAIVQVKSQLTLGCDLRRLLKELATQTSARYILLDLADLGSAAPTVEPKAEPCMRSEVYFG